MRSCIEEITRRNSNNSFCRGYCISWISIVESLLAKPRNQQTLERISEIMAFCEASFHVGLIFSAEHAFFPLETRLIFRSNASAHAPSSREGDPDAEMPRSVRADCRFRISYANRKGR